MQYARSIASTIAFIPLVAAQTSSSCNPLLSTSCPADTGLSSSSLTSDFTSSSLPSDWNTTAGSSRLSYGTDGATFTIKQSGDAPTIQTNFYIFFGVISVTLKSAAGTGIVSSIVLESDDLDEIDWEWIGGDNDRVQTNYFGKGNTTSYDRETWVAASACQTTSHNYTVSWQRDKTEWYVDGTLARTLYYAEAVDGNNYPQTPMRVKIGIWAGGDTALNSEDTVTWAGGATDYSQGPFAMTLEKVEITNQNPASSYTYGDQSGRCSSIDVVGADSSSGTRSAGTARSAGNSTRVGSGSRVALGTTALAASSRAAAPVSTSTAAGRAGTETTRTLLASAMAAWFLLWQCIM